MLHGYLLLVPNKKLLEFPHSIEHNKRVDLFGLHETGTDVFIKIFMREHRANNMYLILIEFPARLLIIFSVDLFSCYS